MLPNCCFDHRAHVRVLIYLDICCLSRPFDQQSQTLVFLPTEATAAVQRGNHRIVADPIDFIRHWQEDDDENRV
jgi:hypothetical protein